MHNVKKRPENDRNVEEMRNNEEEWNNNMIAAYLNTEKRNTNTILFHSWQKVEREKKPRQQQQRHHSKPKITVAKDKARNFYLDVGEAVTVVVILGLFFFRPFPLPLNFSFAIFSNGCVFFSFLFDSFIFTYSPTICVPIRSSLHLGYCCYYVRINKRFVIPFACFFSLFHSFIRSFVYCGRWWMFSKLVFFLLHLIIIFFFSDSLTEVRLGIEF